MYLYHTELHLGFPVHYGSLEKDLPDCCKIYQMAFMEKHLRTQEEAAGESSGLTEVPTDIISNILLRLLVKMLLRFKCVSKSWCSIIGHRFSNLVALTSLRPICITKNFEPSCFSHVGHRHFSSGHQNGFTTSLSQLDQTVNLTVEESQSVNGLICFKIGDLTYVCNISTREVKALLPSGHDLPVHLHCNIRSFSALGFDPITKA